MGKPQPQRLDLTPLGTLHALLRYVTYPRPETWHDTAIIEPGAMVHESAVIGPWTYIGPKAVVNEGCHIVGATIEGVVGKRCRIWRMAHVWDGAVIGDDCMLAQNVMVARATLGNNVRVQNGSTIPHRAFIKDDVYIGAGVRLCNSVHPSALADDKLEAIVLRRGCSIGSNACIVGAVTIGRDAVVGAGAVVVCDVPDGKRALGVPARVE